MKNGSLNGRRRENCDVNELWKKCLLINLFAFDGWMNKWIECLLIYIAYGVGLIMMADNWINL
jgi:hypothetical protein